MMERVIENRMEREEMPRLRAFLQIRLNERHSVGSASNGLLVGDGRNQAITG